MAVWRDCAEAMRNVSPDLRDVAAGPAFPDLKWEVVEDGVNALQLNSSCRTHPCRCAAPWRAECA